MLITRKSTKYLEKITERLEEQLSNFFYNSVNKNSLPTYKLRIKKELLRQNESQALFSLTSESLRFIKTIQVKHH